MQTLEFETNVKNGTILLPKNLDMFNEKHVKVVLMTYDNQPPYNKKVFSAPTLKTKNFTFSRNEANER